MRWSSSISARSSRVSARPGSSASKRAGNRAVGVVRALGREPRSEALEPDPGLGEQRQVADVDGRDDDAAARVHLDELLLREGAERLAHRCPPEPEPLHQLPLADRCAGGELERDDQLTDRVGGALGERLLRVEVRRRELIYAVYIRAEWSDHDASTQAREPPGALTTREGHGNRGFGLRLRAKRGSRTTRGNRVRG